MANKGKGDKRSTQHKLPKRPQKRPQGALGQPWKKGKGNNVAKEKTRVLAHVEKNVHSHTQKNDLDRRVHILGLDKAQNRVHASPKGAVNPVTNAGTSTAALPPQEGKGKGNT